MTAIVFDLDGTLIDTAPDINAIANKVLQSAGGGPITLAQTHSFIGNGVAAFVERMVAAQGLDVSPARQQEMVDLFERHYQSAAEHSRLYPGVSDMLEALKADGHRLGVCTNKPLAPARFVLEHFGIAGHFQVVLGGDSLPVKKPDPAPLLAAFEQLGAGEEDRLYVGDSEVDAQTAARADIPFALFTEGYRKQPVAELEHEVAFSYFNAIPVFVDNRFT